MRVPPPPVIRFDAPRFAERIKWAREYRGYTQEALAKMLKTKMEADTYRKKEDGTNPFRLEELQEICDALQAPYHFPLLDWEAARLADKLLGWPDTPP